MSLFERIRKWFGMSLSAEPADDVYAAEDRADSVDRSLSGADLLSAESFVRHFRDRTLDGIHDERFMAAVELAVMDSHACRMAVRAAELLRRDPEEEGVFLRALIERCTGSYSVSEDELASRGLGRGSGLAVYDDVFFLPITGCVQEIEKLAANREARDRIAEILDHHAGDRSNVNFYVSDILVEPGDLLDVACTDFMALARACDKLMENPRHYREINSGKSDFGILSNLHQAASFDVGRQADVPVLGSRLLPIVMVQLASDDTLLEIDEIVPTDEATIEDWSRQFSGLFHTLGRQHPFAVNRPASLADGAWCAAIDLFRVSMVVRYGPYEWPAGGLLSPMETDASRLSFRIADGTEITRVSRNLVAVSEGEVSRQMYGMVGGRLLTSAERPRGTVLH